MTASKGSGTKVAIGKEASWGTSHVDTLLLPFSSESIAVTVKKTEEPNLLGGKAVTAFDLMQFSVSGDISGLFKPEVAGYLVWAALGGTDTITNPSSTYCHTIIAQTAALALPSYTIFVDRKVAIKKYTGCKINSLKITSKMGDYTTFAVSYKGKDEATATIATSTPPSLKAYKLVNGTLTMGATAFDISGCDLTITNDLDDGVQVNTSGIYSTEPIHGTRIFELNIDMPYETNSETLWTTNFITETLLSTVVLHLESPSIITAALKYRMDVTLSNVAVLDQKRNVSGKDIIGMTIKCVATSVGATEPISVAVYDATSAAYSA